MTDILHILEKVIDERRLADPETSYAARLFAKGRPTIARKLGEEAVETIVAALAQNEAALVGEAADLLFHLLMLLAERGIPLDTVLGELERREGVSGIAEKAARPPE